VRPEPWSKIRVSVVGAGGYAGRELVSLLARHPRAEIASLSGKANGEPFSVDRLLETDPDAVFLATPNEVSAQIAPPLLSAGLAVIDLSGAFRLRDAADYPRWYGFEHPAPALLPEAVYGLPEWCGRIAGSRLVANPGCYATSILLAVKPLVRHLAPGEPVVCDSASGVSGAGRRSEEAYSFAEISGNFKAYGVGTHRHEPEIRAELDLPAATPFVFVAHLLPTVRGILSTIHVGFGRPWSEEEVADVYRRAYAGRPFVEILAPGSLPDLKRVAGTPRASIGFALLAGGRRAVIVSALDNLLKGAASQAVQNFNLAFDLREGEGLGGDGGPDD
jgi:N-acetyl-gamma-glutamyl-phosphate reductase